MKLGFRSKIYSGMLGLLLLLGIVICLVVSRIMTAALLEENRNRGISIGTSLAAQLAEPILVKNILRMKTLIGETVTLSNDLFYAFVLDAAGDPLVHSFKGGFPQDLLGANPIEDGQPHTVRLLDTGQHMVYDYAIPVLIGTSRLGVVRVGLMRTRIQRAINQLIFSAVLTTGVVVFIAGLLGTFLTRQFTGRIKMLHESSEQVLFGNLNVRTAPLLKKNCWDIMACNRTECPAYGRKYHRCWYLAGTLCPTCVEGEYAKKIVSCRDCIVFRKCAGDEIQSLAESFDSMVLSLDENLTELKHAEKTLTEQRHLLRMILDATPDFVSLQDKRLIYIAANRAFCDIIGRSESEIIGKTNLDLFPAAMAQRFQREDRQILETERTLVKEIHLRGSGREQWLHVMKIPVRSDGDRVVGLLASCRDITEFKKMQEQLTQAQKMETVGHLTAGIAHEINTPLGIILGYAQLLQEDVEPDNQISADLKTIVKQARICRKIVADLLSFSRDTGSSPSRVDVNHSIGEVISVVEHTFGLDNVRIRSFLNPDLPQINGDQEKLKQVFANLLANARDAIGANGTIGIETEFDSVEAEVRITITDTGQGIPADRIDRIFDPFFTTKPVDKGTGLGLSVTYGIVKTHGGKIEVASPPPARMASDASIAWSTGFTVHLPADSVNSSEEIKDG